jgi:hypothetical protein
VIDDDQSLLELKPGNVEIRRELAESFEMLATLLEKMKRPLEATKYFQESRAAMKALLNDTPRA